MIKSFRRSKRQSNSSSSPKHLISRVDTTDDSILESPKKVIKALYDYEPQGPGELKFEKGDFFHVVHEDLTDLEGHNAHGWYEATNPMTGTKGMVPISYFEVFNRLRPVASQGIVSHAPSQGTSLSGKPQRNSNQTLYAVTIFGFKAEREDELDITPGENLIICAHHEYEWFIAKPINRLGGPGLVPVSYVKIVDLLNPGSEDPVDDIVSTINTFKIPTVEQWKDQTARYQASTIPLGSISNSTPPPVLSTLQFFDINGGSNRSNRSLLSSSNTAILEAGVESYQLDHGRYQYLVIARLSNSKVRYLYRYYQDFYDLQVKLLELFPFEAGKIENLRRIIPSIPGPLINVNDSISKLRREKLDYYLRNLIALPLHISRSEEVLHLFEVLDNGFDKEFMDDGANIRRVSKPISQQSNYQQDRLSQYLQGGVNAVNSNERSRSSLTSNTINTLTTEKQQQKVKVKFYYEDDIFVLLLPSNLRLHDLKSKLYRRLNLGDDEGELSPAVLESIQLFLKNDFDDFGAENEVTNGEFNDAHKSKLKEFEVDDEEKFQEVLFDKCKLVIIA